MLLSISASTSRCSCFHVIQETPVPLIPRYQDIQVLPGKTRKQNRKPEKQGLLMLRIYAPYIYVIRTNAV